MKKIASVAATLAFALTIGAPSIVFAQATGTENNAGSGAGVSPGPSSKDSMGAKDSMGMKASDGKSEMKSHDSMAAPKGHTKDDMMKSTPNSSMQK